MLEFRMANAVVNTNTGVISTSTAYKAVPDRSTSAVSSGLDRLFGTPASSRVVSRESSSSSVSGQTQEQDVTGAEKRHQARALECVQQELDEYLEDPLETFSRIEQVDGIERRVIFDLLAFWQVCDYPPAFGGANITTGGRKEVPKPLSARNGRSPCTGEFSALRAPLLIREGNLYLSSQPNSAEAHRSPPGSQTLVTKQLSQPH
jgi:hypothetical protein